MAGGWKLEAGGLWLEAGSWRVEAWRLEEAFWHQKWHCVLGIGANVEDRGYALELKLRLESTLFGQILSAKVLEGVGGGR